MFWIAVAVLGVLVLGAYFKGVRKGHGWAKKVIAAALIALVATILFRGLAFSILALFLGSGVVVAYFKGVRKKVPWAKKVVVCGCAALLALIVCRGCWKRAPAEWTDEDEHDVAFARAKTLARALRPHLKPGSRILILGDIPDDSAVVLPQSLAAWKQGLSAGLDDDTWSLAGYHYVEVGDPSAAEKQLSEVLAELEKPVDVIVSFAGLPEGFERTKLCAERETGPKIAVLLIEPSEAELMRMRKWLTEGLVDSVAVETGGETEALR